jgi:peptidoglycan hydrolase-like protein with peptidoglycan-binding domain
MKLQELVASGTGMNLRNVALDSVLVGDIQNRLAKLGCLDPPADGDFGPVTQFVLGQYARQVGLPLDETLDVPLAESLLRQSEDTFLPLTLGSDFASLIIKYMQLRNFWFARLPEFLTIVYVEGADESGKPNADEFNKFNDRRIVLSIDNGKPAILLNTLATTEPGKFFTDNPENSAGAARIAFGQYKSWRVGIHKASKQPPIAHEALVQVADVTVHRDLNKDGKRTGDKTDVGSGFGINQHSGHNASINNIGKASAGCLVGRTTDEHKLFMKLVKTDPRFKKASNGYRYMSTIIAGDDLKIKVG